MSFHTRRSALDKMNAGLWLFKFARILEISLPLMFGLLCIDPWVSLLYLLLYLFCVSHSLFQFEFDRYFQTILYVKEISPRGGGTQQSFIREGCAQHSNPLTFYISLFRKGNPFLHCAFYWQMVPLSHA